MNWKWLGLACIVIGLMGQIYAQWGFMELAQARYVTGPIPYEVLQFTSDVALRASTLVGLGIAILIARLPRRK